jgi:hypothetical protein
MDTGGAVATGRVADFLRADSQDTGQGVLDTLVAAAAQLEQAAGGEPTAAEPVYAPEVDEAMLETLSSQQAETTDVAADEPQAEPAPPKPAPQADRNVLDSLLDDPNASGTDENA